MARMVKNIGLGVAVLMMGGGGLLLGVSGGLVGGFFMWAGQPEPEPAECPEVVCPECPVCEAEPEPEPEPELEPDPVPVVHRPRPDPEPEPEPPSGATRLVVSGDPPDQLWLEQNGHRMADTEALAPGDYDLYAALSGNPARHMGTVSVAEGQETAQVRCSASWGKCRPQ